MTTRKHLKARVRARMAKTGERYAVARAHVGAGASSPSARNASGSAVVNGVRHFPGIHPETTVLRLLATHAGVRGREGVAPGEEAMLALGGGPGAGVFAFHYEKEAFSSLFLAGRHRWEDSRAFVEGALRRLGLEPTVLETGSRKQAERDLRGALGAGPVAVWVDSVELGYRGEPAEGSGGGYHVLVVYAIDGHEAIVGDLAAEPIRLPLDVLARARARIAKDRHRLLSVRAAGPVDLGAAVGAGLVAGSQALVTERRRNFMLGAFADLADRMTASGGANRWARVFPRGRRLWSGLSSIHRFAEAYGTGGGLLRPMLGRALAEAGMERAAAEYAALGAAWTALARAALPDGVPLLAETRAIQERIERRFAHAGPLAEGENRADWARLRELEAAADADFPLSGTATSALLADLAARLRAIHAAEVTALDALTAEAGR